MGASTKNANNCPSSFYCPLATGDYLYDEETINAADSPTRCPLGTGNNQKLNKKTLMDCTMDEEYRTLTDTSIIIRGAFAAAEEEAQRLRLEAAAEEEVSSAIAEDEGSARLLFQSSRQERVKTKQNARRKLASSSQVTEYFDDLYGIEASIADYKVAQVDDTFTFAFTEN